MCRKIGIHKSLKPLLVGILSSTTKGLYVTVNPSKYERQREALPFIFLSLTIKISSQILQNIYISYVILRNAAAWLRWLERRSHNP